MRPFVCAFGVVYALLSGHYHDIRELLAAILAGVFLLFAAFVELVTAFVAAVRMTGTGSGGELADIGELLSAIFAIVVLFFFIRSVHIASSKR